MATADKLKETILPSEKAIEIESMATQIMLQGYIATLERMRPGWKDERVIKFDDMIAKMENTLSYLKTFESE